jgi:hypothetical protein
MSTSQSYLFIPFDLTYNTWWHGLAQVFRTKVCTYVCVCAHGTMQTSFSPLFGLCLRTPDPPTATWINGESAFGGGIQSSRTGQCSLSLSLSLSLSCAPAQPLHSHHYPVNPSFLEPSVLGFHFVSCADGMAGKCMLSLKNHSLCVSCSPKCLFFHVGAL